MRLNLILSLLVTSTPFLEASNLYARRANFDASPAALRYRALLQRRHYPGDPSVIQRRGPAGGPGAPPAPPPPGGQPAPPLPQAAQQGTPPVGGAPPIPGQPPGAPPANKAAAAGTGAGAGAGGSPQLEAIRKYANGPESKWKPLPLEQKPIGATADKAINHNNAQTLVEQAQDFVKTLLESGKNMHFKPPHQKVGPKTGPGGRAIALLMMVQRRLQTLHTSLPSKGERTPIFGKALVLPPSLATTATKKPVENKPIAEEKAEPRGSEKRTKQRLEVLSQAYELFLVLNEGGKQLQYTPLHHNAIKQGTPPDDKTAGGVTMGLINMVLQSLDHQIPKVQQKHGLPGAAAKPTGDGLRIQQEYKANTLQFKTYPLA